MKTLRSTLYRVGYLLARMYWFVWRPTTEGVKCVVLYSDKILWVKHSYGSSQKTTVGGGIKRGESPEEAVIREVREEVGLTVNTMTKLGTVPTQQEYKKDTIHVFAAKVDTDKISINDGEIGEAGWFSIQSIPSDVSPLFMSFLSMAGIYKK